MGINYLKLIPKLPFGPFAFSRMSIRKLLSSMRLLCKISEVTGLSGDKLLILFGNIFVYEKRIHNLGSLCNSLLTLRFLLIFHFKIFSLFYNHSR